MPRWTARETAELLALPRYPVSDKTVDGEQIHLGFLIGRSPAACSGRLSILRRAGEAGLDEVSVDTTRDRPSPRR